MKATVAYLNYRYRIDLFCPTVTINHHHRNQCATVDSDVISEHTSLSWHKARFPYTQAVGVCSRDFE